MLSKKALELLHTVLVCLESEDLGMLQDTADGGMVMLEPPEAERQAEDRVAVDHTSDTSILGSIKKHLKVWVTLRRPIGKVRRLLWNMILMS